MKRADTEGENEFVGRVRSFVSAHGMRLVLVGIDDQ
jgi:hypothetical protein